MTKLEWNLQEIFINVHAFYDEINYVKKLLENVKRFENIQLNSAVLLELLNKKWNIKERSNKILIYGSLMYYKNVHDNNCIELKRVAEEFNNEVDTSLKFIDRKILDLGFLKVSDFIKEKPKLKIYKLSFDNLFRLEEHVQSEKVNQKIKEDLDKINDQLSQYNGLLRDIQYGSIIVNGEEVQITASNFNQYITSKERDVRRQTYFVVNHSFIEKKNSFAHILNRIYGYRIDISILEKYTSVLDKILFEENISSEIINKLIKSVHNHLDLIQTYLQIKFDFLKIEDPHLYDFELPLISDLPIHFSLEEAQEIILKALEPLGSEYIKIVKILFEGHIDAELNENKHQSITFSWNTYAFMNFRGTYIDLKNMIHEIGHIVNYYLSKNKQPFIYEDSTIFVGEIASIVNEILLNTYLYEHAKSLEEKAFYLSKKIENYFSSVFKQVMYTEFENDLYKIRSTSELTSEILSERYFSFLKKYYGNYIFYDQISNVEWSRLGHLYRWSYYPYKYATGLLIASVVVDSLLYKKSLSRKEYIAFLSAGSSQYSLDLLKMLNMDLVNTDIIESGFNIMAKDLFELQKVLALKK